MACKTICHLSVPKLKSFRPLKTELGAKEFGEFFFKLYGKMEILLPTNMAAAIQMYRHFVNFEQQEHLNLLICQSETCRDTLK